MMKFAKKNRKIILKSLSILAFGVVPIVLSSCSSMSTFLERSVSKQDANFLDTNTSLSSYADFALNSDTGMKSYMKEIADELILDWLKNNTSSVNSSAAYANEQTTINDDYSNLLTTYQNKYPSAWQLKFQQEVLDPAGGTEQSYKQAKWNEWAEGQFQTYLFEKSYLTYAKTDGSLIDTSNTNNINRTDLYNALKDQSFQFAVADKENASNYDLEYAKFMQYIWDQYVQVENPFVVDMSLWKYGTPSQGLGDLYTHAESTTTTTDDSGTGTSTTTSSLKIDKQDDTTTGSDSSGDSSDNTSTTTANTGSYIYPYFGNDAQSTTGTVSKFYNFLTSASGATDTNVTLDGSTSTISSVKIPFLSSWDTNGYGLLNIPNDYTDDSSTYILAKNASIFTDLYPEFAAGSSYLFWRNSGITNNNVNFDSANATTTGNYGIPSIDTNISKAVGTPTISNDATTGLDPISKLFISQTKSFTSSTNYELQLDSSYVNEIINANGPLSGLRGKDLYVIDSFVPIDTNLTNYLLLRNTAGVHAITIDGYYFINNSSTTSSSLSVSDKKKRAGQVVLFRSLYNNLPTTSKESNYNFAIDVQSELKTFYTDNLTWLVYNYAQNTDQNLFDMNVLSLTDAEKNAANAINNFLHEVSYYTKVDDYNNSLYTQKNTYSLNYGVDAYKNGLAAPWTYATMSTNDATTYDENPTIAFQVAATASIVKDPFSLSNATVSKNYDGSTFTAQTAMQSAITSLANNLTALSNVSFDGFKYSQYIYSNSAYVNAALLSFSSESSDLADLTKINYLKKYIQASNKFDFTTLKFTNFTFDSKDISSYLNYGLANFFFNSSFTSSTNKWLKFDSTNNSSWSSAVTGTAPSGFSQLSALSDYKIKLWKETNQVMSSTAIDSYFSLYSAVAGIIYMLDNNAQYFLDYLSNQISIGTYAYVGWQNSQNNALTHDAATTASDLLSASKLRRNINNNFVSSYLGGQNLYNSITGQTASNLDITYSPTLESSSWTTTKNPNLGIHSSYQDTSTVSSYYSVSSNMVGFLGLQTGSTNTFNTLVSNVLLTSPTTDNPTGQGLLYAYGSSYDELISYVQNVTSLSSVNTIANDLASKLKQTSLQAVADDTKLTLNEKKEKLITAITNLKDNTSTSVSEAFKARTGIVAGTQTSENNNLGLLTDSTNPNVQFSSYVIQINNDDVSSLSSLITRLKDNNGTDETTKTNNAYDIFSNLAVQQATNSGFQTSVLNAIIAQNGKVEAYDVRLFTSLGATWISNWKVTNTTSSTGTDSSSSS